MTTDLKEETMKTYGRKLLTGIGIAAALAASLAGPCSALEIRIGAANMREYADPGKDHSNVGSMQYYNSFEPLIGKDATKVEPEFRPCLAESWTMISPTVIELHLRKDVVFHNGDAMTADDVVFSLERMFHPTFAPYVSTSREYFSNMEKAEKVNDYTVRVSTKRPDPILITLLNVQQSMIVPEKYIKGLTGSPDVAEDSDFEAFGLKPVGTGPYAITELIPGQKLVWERHEKYWGAKPDLQKATIVRINEMAARITALKNGEVDIITNVPPDQIGTIEKVGALKVVGLQTPIFHLVFFNTNNPKLADKRLRQALCLAIDRKLLNEALWHGKARVPEYHTFPQFGKLYDPSWRTIEYNPEKARKLLKEAGYDGTPIRFDTAATYYTNGFLAAQAIREMWAEVGVTMNLNVQDKWTGDDADMEARNWSNPMYFPDPAGSYGTMWSPTGARITAKSWTPVPPKGYSSYEELWNKFRYSMDATDRAKHYREIMEYVAEEAPYTLLYQPYESWGLRKDIDWKPLPGHIPYVLDFHKGMIAVNR